MDRKERKRSPPPDSAMSGGARRGWFAKDYNPVRAGSIDGSDTKPHDRALKRALAARYDVSRDPQVQGDPYATLFVARLSFDTREAAVQTFFEQFGRVVRVRLVRDVATQRSKGYAFVEFEDERAFERAYRRAHRQMLDGATILVDYERSRIMKGWKPRRLGGGLGGRKESGQLRSLGYVRSGVAPRFCFHPAVEELLLDMATEFVGDVVGFSGHLAKHRRSTVLEPKDLQLCLAKNYGISLAGVLPSRPASAAATAAGTAGADASGLLKPSNLIHAHRLALKRKAVLRARAARPEVAGKKLARKGSASNLDAK